MLSKRYCIYIFMYAKRAKTLSKEEVSLLGQTRCLNCR